jgi:hypothetical protein
MAGTPNSVCRADLRLKGHAGRGASRRRWRHRRAQLHPRIGHRAGGRWATRLDFRHVWAVARSSRARSHTSRVVDTRCNVAGRASREMDQRTGEVRDATKLAKRKDQEVLVRDCRIRCLLIVAFEALLSGTVDRHVAGLRRSSEHDVEVADVSTLNRYDIDLCRFDVIVFQTQNFGVGADPRRLAGRTSICGDWLPILSRGLPLWHGWFCPKALVGGFVQS